MVLLGLPYGRHDASVLSSGKFNPVMRTIAALILELFADCKINEGYKLPCRRVPLSSLRTTL